ncbi:glycosyltransferase involved in cell wall biosynthesis [Microbacterium marinum]|uniref:D-inositol 3-phosphate glycosyltransferase n=1 Tax=Microbacterium marinum TaxID=421115 RepID=A0A7W7BNY3_9MICO|nr:glycosyltransferase [Microbacterium marinum]MBB4666130.1 glycosyltransferase involved in cell wall biosynthesis [Microbacterium marinum]
MKIVQVISVIATKYGGPSTGSVELNKQLNARGVDALLLTSRLNGSGPQLSDDEIEQLVHGGAQIAAYKASAPRRLQNSWGLLRAIVCEVRSADLVHMHGQYLIPHAAAYIAARRWGVPYGIQPHGGLEPYQRAQSRVQKVIYGWLIGSRMLRNASYVQFASESEAQHAADVVRTEQARVAPLGATLAQERPMRSVEEWLERTPRESVYLFLGRLARKKRPEVLLDAWATSGIGRTGSRLIIAGPDDELTVAELSEKARHLDIADQVLFTGRVDAHERSWLYSQSGVFVLPSDNENFALTVAEAMLSGCYAVVTTNVAAATHVNRAGGGTVLDGVGDLAATLTTLAAEPSTVRSGGIRAAEYAARELTWEPLARSIEAELPLGPTETPRPRRRSRTV